MTTVIKVTCPICNVNADLAPEDVRLSVCGLLVGLSTYTWHCSDCQRFVYRHADRRTIDLLVSGGVTARQHQAGSRRVRREPLTEDDVIRFGLEIEATPNGVSRFDPARAS